MSRPAKGQGNFFASKWSCYNYLEIFNSSQFATRNYLDMEVLKAVLNDHAIIYFYILTLIKGMVFLWQIVLNEFRIPFLLKSILEKGVEQQHVWAHLLNCNIAIE